MPRADRDEAWIDAWMDGVADGRFTMSQRAMSAIDRHGGVARVVAAARARGLHLLELTDDTGKTLVAASRSPFKTLC